MIEQKALIEKRCVRCDIKIESRGNHVLWNPDGWLCDSCQRDWTELFFSKRLEKAFDPREDKYINNIWRQFITFNPSSRFSGLRNIKRLDI